MTSISGTRLLVIAAATLVLFVAMIVLLPDAIPLFPAIVVVPLWLTLSPARNVEVSGTRRILWLSFALGVAVFVVVAVLYLALG